MRGERARLLQGHADKSGNGELRESGARDQGWFLAPDSRDSQLSVLSA
jgi:hypothetical protein